MNEIFIHELQCRSQSLWYPLLDALENTLHHLKHNDLLPFIETLCANLTFHSHGNIGILLSLHHLFSQGIIILSKGNYMPSSSNCSGYYPPYSPFEQSYTPETPQEDYGTLSREFVDVESTYAKGQQFLEELTAMGVTQEELLNEGMHPIFLKQLYSRIQPQSPQLPLRSTSVSLIPVTPEPQPQAPQPTQTIQPNDRVAVDVDHFLDALEHSINAPNGLKKRGPPPETSAPKRRAFGVPQKELVIDVSDDDGDSSEGEAESPQKPEPLKPVRPNVRIPDRPPLTQQVKQSLDFCPGVDLD